MKGLFRLTAKGDASSYIILWVTTILAALILVGWYMNNIYPYSQELRIIQHDLDLVTGAINTGCNSLFYQTSVNPRLLEGQFSVNDSQVCFRTKKNTFCKETVCDTDVFLNESVQSIIEIRITKNESDQFEIEI